jgi:hypothetical protein
MISLRILSWSVAGGFRISAPSRNLAAHAVSLGAILLALSAASCSENAAESTGEVAVDSAADDVPTQPPTGDDSGGTEGTSAGSSAPNPTLPVGAGGTENGGGAAGAGEPNSDANGGGAAGAGGTGGAYGGAGTGNSTDGDAGDSTHAGGSENSGGVGGSAGSPGADDPAEANGGAPSESGEYGFTYRIPGADQLDWLCTFQQTSMPGYVYVRLTQTGTMQSGIATVPVYSVEQAQLSIDGDVEMLSSAVYDYGGGHHNDSLSFAHDGKTYKYYHSSFGFGFRACQMMDCLNIYEAMETAPETEGCGSDRALPEVCVSIDGDGTHAPLVDNFQKCPGDAG